VCLLFFKGWKKIGLPIFLALLGVGLADLVARRIIKALIMRPRPHYVGLDCSMSSCWGFVSSHSTNVTAACTILCLYDRRNLFWSIPVIFIVGISRLYFLDHFPLDVIGGTVLGFAIGFVIIRIFADPLSKVRG
jgi:undecaprenyl-diphosphatase